MSLLAEVLSTAEKIELDQINAKVSKITSAVENCKRDVTTFMENVYVTYTERPKHNRTLLNGATRLYNETIDLQNAMEQIAKKGVPEMCVEVEQLSLSLQKTNVMLNIIMHIRNLHEGVVKLREYGKSEMYVNAMEEYKKVEAAFSSIAEDERVAALDEIKVTIDTQKNMLLNKLSNTFRDNVIITVNSNNTGSCMKIVKSSTQVTEVLQALYLYTSSIFLLDEVTKFLWHHVFVPIVDGTCEVKKTESDTCNILEVIVKESSKRMSYGDVFENIKKVITFLNDNFNYKLDEHLTSVGYVGRDIRDNLSELIIKHCLQDTIPSTNEGLEKYNIVIEDTEELQKCLVHCQIFSEDTQSILAYANNIDILFINKRCQQYIKTSQEIMKKDLHNLKEVGTQYDSNNPLASLEEFSRCSVSKSAIELTHFLEKLLEEATTASDVASGRLFCTVEKILKQYTTFVPEYHKKLLQTIPQQVALYHNNCHYIAEKLPEWKEKYSHKLATKLKIEPEIFTDDSYVLKRIATEMFTSYVDSQIKQIQEIMKDVGIRNVQTLDSLEPSTEKCIRQCLRQQELLKTVWGKVLSYPVYNRTIGLILDSLCNIIINDIVALEDVPSSVAEQLSDLLKIVVTRGPKLFTDPKEVSLFVPSWYKFNELVFVLNASLLDINDRWADGKGPLALQFKPEELKRLIRALFQNTDRRAAVLAKIM